MAELMVNLESW